MKSFFRFLNHAFVILVLTILSQIGGLIWILTIIVFIGVQLEKKWFVPVFISLYLAISFLLLPSFAKVYGRVPLPIFKSSEVAPHNFLTVLLNRHYVKKELLEELKIISSKFYDNHANSKLYYLDANFPLIDGFPLLPHRSHDDGKKIDLCFMYTKNGSITNAKPSRSGYGYFESPQKGEFNQIDDCLSRGYWQYDSAKFITLGSSGDYDFDKVRTKTLLEIILNRPKTNKVFIEPHLKDRLELNHIKCRFHGCKAVRHDDHIHYQIY